MGGYLVALHSQSTALRKRQPWKASSVKEVLHYYFGKILPNKNYVLSGYHILIHGTDEFPMDNHVDFYATLQQETSFEFIAQKTTLDKNLETTSVAM